MSSLLNYTKVFRYEFSYRATTHEKVLLDAIVCYTACELWMVEKFFCLKKNVTELDDLQTCSPIPGGEYIMCHIKSEVI